MIDHASVFELGYIYIYICELHHANAVVFLVRLRLWCGNYFHYKLKDPWVSHLAGFGRLNVNDMPINSLLNPNWQDDIVVIVINSKGSNPIFKGIPGKFSIWEVQCQANYHAAIKKEEGTHFQVNTFSPQLTARHCRIANNPWAVGKIAVSRFLTVWWQEC